MVWLSGGALDGRSVLAVMLQVWCCLHLGFLPRTKPRPDVIANAANEETRHKAVDYFRSE